MEFLLITVLVSVIVYYVWQGYAAETAPPPPTVTTADGLKVPVCARCGTGLVTLQRQTQGPIAAVVGGGLFFVGLVVLLLIHAMAGGAILVVGLLIILAGRSKRTVLTCPACGHDARILH